MEALKASGVNVFEGFFQTIDDPDNARVIVREKQSDVALALSLYRDAAKHRYDLAVLLSGDSDFAPALKAVREDFPDKRLLLITPPAARKCGELMKWTTLDRRKTHASLLRLCQFPAEMVAFGQTIRNPYLTY